MSRIARASDHGIVVLRPVVLPRQTPLQADGDFIKPHQGALETIVDAFEDRGVVAEGVVCRSYDVADSIAQTAERHGTSLILMPGRPPVGEIGGFGRDTVDGVIQETSSPVIVYREPPAPTDPERVMVAVAGGPHTEAMLSWARLLAEAWGARIELFHVLDAEAGESARDEARGMLAEIAEETGAIQLSLLDGEDVTQAVLDVSAPEDALILGAPTRSRWRHLFYGSRARKVQRTSPGWSFVVHEGEDEPSCRKDVQG